MSITKSTIINEVIAQTGLCKAKSSQALETMLETIKGTLASGEELMISGFGKFQVKSKSERKGRNPATGKDLVLDPRNVVTFKCSDVLKGKLNGMR